MGDGDGGAAGAGFHLLQGIQQAALQTAEMGLLDQAEQLDHVVRQTGHDEVAESGIAGKQRLEFGSRQLPDQQVGFHLDVGLQFFFSVDKGQAQQANLAGSQVIQTEGAAIG